MRTMTGITSASGHNRAPYLDSCKTRSIWRATSALAKSFLLIKPLSHSSSHSSSLHFGNYILRFQQFLLSTILSVISFANFILRLFAFIFSDVFFRQFHLSTFTSNLPSKTIIWSIRLASLFELKSFLNYSATFLVIFLLFQKLVHFKISSRVHLHNPVSESSESSWKTIGLPSNLRRFKILIGWELDEN